MILAFPKKKIQASKAKPTNSKTNNSKQQGRFYSTKHTRKKPPSPPQQLHFIHDPSIRKLSKRTRRRLNKKVWIQKDLPTGYKVLEATPYWKKLSKDLQRLFKLAWPDRHFCLSYIEIAKLLEISERQAIRLIQKWERQELIKKEHEYMERRGKLTKIHKRNYYVLTKKGQQEMTDALKQLYPDWNLKMSPRKDYPLDSTLCQDAETSFERKFLGGELAKMSLKEYQAFLENQLDNMLAQDDEIPAKVKFIFELFGFKKYLLDASPSLNKKLCKIPLKKLVTILTWITEKLKRGWKMRKFWSVFVWCMKLGKPPFTWMTQKANEFMEAIQGSRTMHGIDTSAVVGAIRHLQKLTGRKLSRQGLINLLHYGTQHLRAALDLTVFKSKCLKLRDWVSYVNFVAKKPLMVISQMYKSEDTLRQEQAEEDELMRSQKNMTDAQAWDNLISNCEEESRVKIGNAPPREI